jgi:UTP:GlnB (protein PII) uridylyltransferase
LAAMALPKDKAELLTELLEQHLRTQEARAAGVDDPDVIDAEAEEVTNKAGE